jgi:hypothetical protein
MSPDSTTQASRIIRLERQVQRAQALACGGALLTATLLLTGYLGKSGDVVQAERFELVTTQGVRQVILSADTLGFALTLLDVKGRPTGILRLSDEPRVAVQTGRGREVAGLGSPKVHNLSE